MSKEEQNSQEYRAVFQDLVWLSKQVPGHGAFDPVNLQQRDNLRQFLVQRLHDQHPDLSSGIAVQAVLHTIDQRARPFPLKPPKPMTSAHKALAVGILIRLYDDNEEQYPAAIGARRRLVFEQFGLGDRGTQGDRNDDLFAGYLQFIEFILADKGNRKAIAAEARKLLATRRDSESNNPPKQSGFDRPINATIDITQRIDWERWKHYASRTVSIELVGADSVVNRLADYLTSPDPGPTIVSGEGGIGKTSVVVKAMSMPTVRERYVGAIWVTSINVGVSEEAEAEYRWHQILTDLAKQLSVATEPSMTQIERGIQQQISELPADALLLCVIDNLEGLRDGEKVIEQLAEIGLRSPHGVALTSRPAVDRLRAGGKQIAMTPLSRENTAELVFQVNPGLRDGGEEIVNEILRISHGNPYLILLVASQYRDEKLPIEYVIDELKRSEATYSYMFKRSIKILSRTTTPQLAAALMQGFCRFYRGTVITYDELLDRSQIQDPRDFKTVLGVAGRLNLVQATDVERHYSIHSLLYEFLKGDDVLI